MDGLTNKDEWIVGQMDDARLSGWIYNIDIYEK